ncbi:MAG: hypothetical protein BGO69_04695 [Bacteroidetes bacterium 46-16]|nr:MAG: hypothetical protein BGO69_04695 [Bacteroidetes bacterium 46-16]
MKQLHLVLVTIAASSLLATSCKKKSSDNATISQPPFQIGQPVSDSQPLCGAINGTMETGKTYSISCDVTVNAGDTLLIQPGVRINMSPAATIVVKGTLLSLGTKDQPNWITVDGVSKTDNPGQDPSVDPAYAGKWTGINCDTSCQLLVVRWTHLEYGGGVFATAPLPGISTGDDSYVIWFQNSNGTMVLEDSWIYGCDDDAIRIAGGKFSIMRNTIEKAGYTGGDVFNAKHGSVGDMAYNLFVGCATNGTKASDKGSNDGPQTNVNMYNNTYINCGWRRSSSGRGGCINYEEGAKGSAYNNLVVNCKYGLRIVNNPSADTANMHYGNTFNYGDSLDIVNEFYPLGYITVPQSTDIPAPATFLPGGYNLGDPYDGSSLLHQNDPKFVNFPLPSPYDVIGISYTSGYDFHLQSGSPALGKGFTGFSPLAAVPVNANFGASELTAPGSDIGCYQANGNGNKH